jgi:hypothetical protein
VGIALEEVPSEESRGGHVLWGELGRKYWVGHVLWGELGRKYWVGQRPDSFHFPAAVLKDPSEIGC